MWKSIFIWTTFCACGSLGEVKISVYYETLCPYSVAFLVNQYDPVYQLYADDMLVQLIPYGKATASNESGSWEFVCQHGEAECYGNKVHSCALALYPFSQSSDFVVCAMDSGNATLDDNLEQCAVSSNISWTSLQECISSGQGDELLAANGRITDELIPNISNSIPSIAFNDLFNRQLHRLSLSNFEDVFVYLNDQIQCGFCHFLQSNGSEAVLITRMFIFRVILLILILQKLLV